ncbi:MAG: carboxypeptidase-like regulatory domain-containing protein [Bacteroidota bacterium]
MKNLLILHLLVLSSFNCNAQTYLIKGTIEDEQKKPIPFVNVYLADKSTGVVTNSIGAFELNVGIKKNDSIVFSCLGYKTSIVPLQEWLSNSNKKIVLQIASNELKEVNVTGYKFKTKELNYFKKPEASFSSEDPEFEHAILIPNKKGYSGFVKNVGVYVRNIGNPKAPFRVHIYECNQITNEPGKELTQNSIVAHATLGNEWVMVNLDSLQIKIQPNGFFVGIEALPIDGYVTLTPHQLDSIAAKLIAGYSIAYRDILYLGSESHLYKKGVRGCFRKYLAKWATYKIPNGKYLDSGDLSFIAVKTSISYYSKNKDKTTYLSNSDFNSDFEKDNERVMKKALTQVQKYDDKKFPHSNIKEFFESNLKAVKENNISYLFTYLYLINKEEKEDFFIEMEKRSKNEQLFSNEEIKNAADFFNYCLNTIEQSNLIQIKENFYKLQLPDKRNIYFLQKKGKWYAYPNTVNELAKSEKRSVFK